MEVVGWDVQFDRIKQRRRLGRGPRRDAGRHHPGAVLRRARRLREPHRTASTTSAARPPTRRASGRRPSSQGTDGTFAVPWFTEARAIYYRKDVLEKAGIDPATAFTDVDAFQQTLQTIKDKVPTIDGKPIPPFGTPGKKAFDLVHHVMPFVWDDGGAELSATTPRSRRSTARRPQQGVDFVAGLVTKGLFDKSMLERDGTQVENQFKGGRLAVWIGGPWVLSTIARTDDKNWVPAAREERRRRRRCPPARRARRSRSSAART